MSIRETDDRYVMATYKRFPVELVSGKGSIIQDSDGKKYIDMGSGIAVTAFGIADDLWKEAVTKQLGTLQHTSNLYYTSPCAELARLLCERTGMSKVFFGNSGAEANECAIKVARKFACDTKGPGCHTIVTLENSFHGRTLTTLAATGQEHYHELFQPLTPGFVHAKANDLEGLKKIALENNAAAVMIECVQGEGGVIALDPAFVKGVRSFTEEHGMTMIVDEVQTGNGRSGSLYAYMTYGIEPDIVSTAKGIGGGLPIGLCMVNEKCSRTLGYGDHGSTFGGNPVCCAGAISILSRIDDTLLEQVRRKSAFIFDTFRGAEGVEDVTGLGLMIGIKTTKSASEVVAKCMENGVLCLTAKDKVRLLPALNIPFETLSKACEIIKDACRP